MFRLTHNATEELLERREAGMGYQIVRGTLRRHLWTTPEEREFHVLNEVLLIGQGELTSIRSQTRALLRKQVSPSRIYEHRLQSAEIGYLFTLASVLSRSQSAVFLKEAEAPAQGGASSQTPQSTNWDDRFSRFTAYRNDRRITRGRGLLPGTYATTRQDATIVWTGREAVARYALPNPDPAIFKFPIDPLSRTEYQLGVVQAAYGQPGGVVEILFGEGVADGSVGDPVTLPAG